LSPKLNSIFCSSIFMGYNTQRRSLAAVTQTSGKGQRPVSISASQ
jgi:hypothetical protein